MDRRLTIVDIAKIAGVSRQTISRVLNNKGEVNEDTRKRILDIINEVGFQPSIQARSMVTKKTNMIALLVPDITNPFFSEIVRGIERTIRIHGFNAMLFSTDEGAEREISCIRLSRHYNVDGIILCSPRLDDLNLSKLIPDIRPLALLNREIEEIDGVFSLIVDAQTGGYDAAKHLLDSGHKEIGIIVGPSHALSSIKRLNGYKQALSEYGVEIDDDLIVHVDTPDTNIHEEAQELINRHVTAILTYNDMAAANVIQTCTDMGLEVPKDISVIGFDGIPLSELLNPRLTTMELPLFNIGETLANALMDIISGKETSYKRAVVLPTLKLRNSTIAH